MRPSTTRLPADADHSFDITTASRPSSTAASTAMAEIMPVMGTWPLRKPSSRDRSTCGSSSRSARTTGRPVDRGGSSMAAKRSPGRPTTNSAARPARPHEFDGHDRVDAAAERHQRPPLAAHGRRPGSGVERRRLDAQAGQVEPVAVGELAQPVHVERAQEGGARRGRRACRQLDHGRRRGLVVRHARQQVDQRAASVDLGPSHRPPPGKATPLDERPAVERVAAGQRAAVDVVALVAEDVADGLAHRRSRAERREAAAGPLGPVAEERRRPAGADARRRDLAAGTPPPPAAAVGGPEIEAPVARPVGRAARPAAAPNADAGRPGDFLADLVACDARCGPDPGDDPAGLGASAAMPRPRRPPPGPPCPASRRAPSPARRAPARTARWARSRRP